MEMMKCKQFVNMHCSFDCPNFSIDEFEFHFDIPASDAGLDRVKCKDCLYADNLCNCDDCLFQGSNDCPSLNHD